MVVRGDGSLNPRAVGGEEARHPAAPKTWGPKKRKLISHEQNLSHPLDVAALACSHRLLLT